MGKRIRKSTEELLQEKRLEEARYDYHCKTVAFNENPHCHEISVKTFYKFLFGKVETEREGHQEDEKPNFIVHFKKNGREEQMQTRLLFDSQEFEQFKNYYFAIVAPCTFYSRHSSSANVRELCAFVVDLDGVKPSNLDNLLAYFDKKSSAVPTPSVIVNSGTGLHLYYVLEQPIKTFKSVQKHLNAFKNVLIKKCWNGYTSTITSSPGRDPRQYQSIVQGYRIIGSDTKIAYKGEEGITVRAYAYGKLHYVSLDYLNSFLDVELINDNATRALKLTPEKLTPYPLREPEKFAKWKEAGFPVFKPSYTQKHDGLYQWWLRTFPDKVESGHRYWCICILTAFAIKCGISKEQVLEDAYSVFERLDHLTTDPQNHFTYEDIETAVDGYFKQSYIHLSRAWSEKAAGFQIPKAKRNGRKREDHIKLINFIRDEIKHADWRNKNGAPEKTKIVKAWRAEHPEGTKADCARETGLSKPTVLKWWDS